MQKGGKILEPKWLLFFRKMAVIEQTGRAPRYSANFKPFDFEEMISTRVDAAGGFVDAHRHLDRAFSLQSDLVMEAAAKQCNQKWLANEVVEMKGRVNVGEIYDRMAYTGERMLRSGVTVVGTFVDVDKDIKEKALDAADKFKDEFKGDLEIVTINQVLHGVLGREAKEWFDVAANRVDIIGGLPKKDYPYLDEHVDVVLETAKALGKPAHLHLDQFNDSLETETEMVAVKVINLGLQGKVSAIHSISLAAHPIEYRNMVYGLLKMANMTMIACPSAWIDHPRKEALQPFHNALTPVDELVAHGVRVAIGKDNESDFYKAWTGTDMLRELWLMANGNRFFEIDELVNIATVNGRFALGLPVSEEASVAA